MMTVTTSTRQVDFWNVNLPPQQWTAKCPDYLAAVDEWDRVHLGTPDEDYVPMDWKEVSDIVRKLRPFQPLYCNLFHNIYKDTNRLEEFKRIPSQLHRYRKYIADVKENYGSIMNFILKERVKWDDLTPKGEPFQCPSKLDRC